MYKKSLLTLFYLFFGIHLFGQNSIQNSKWMPFFSDKVYLDGARKINDNTFWKVDESYTYYDTVSLLLIYENGVTEEALWQYDGLSSLIDKKKTILNENFDPMEKEDVAYIAFDNLLLRNPNTSNSVSGDFTIVCVEGPISIFREYYTSPITRENIASGFTIYKEGKLIDNFYLGKFDKKAFKLVEDYPRLGNKVKKKLLGYTNTEENLFRIAEEYNLWIKEYFPHIYEEYEGLMID